MDDVRLHMSALYLAVRIMESFQEEDEELSILTWWEHRFSDGSWSFRRESVVRDEVRELDGGQAMKVLTCKRNEFGMRPKCYWSH